MVRVLGPVKIRLQQFVPQNLEKSVRWDLSVWVVCGTTVTIVGLSKWVDKGMLREAMSYVKASRKVTIGLFIVWMLGRKFLVWRKLNICRILAILLRRVGRITGVSGVETCIFMNLRHFLIHVTSPFVDVKFNRGGDREKVVVV